MSTMGFSMNGYRNGYKLVGELPSEITAMVAYEDELYVATKTSGIFVVWIGDDDEYGLVFEARPAQQTIKEMIR